MLRKNKVVQQHQKHIIEHKVVANKKKMSTKKRKKLISDFRKLEAMTSDYKNEFYMPDVIEFSTFSNSKPDQVVTKGNKKFEINIPGPGGE